MFKFDHTNLHLMTTGMVGLLSCLFLSSCNNDDYPVENELGKVSENICFGISSDIISSDVASQTRGMSGKENGCTVDRFVLRSENTSDTLCVRATVSDGIVSSTSATEKTMTRGVPVTSLSAFHVSAYWKKEGTLLEQFFMDETATDKGGRVWETENNYYWPGAEYTLRFYAYAPINAGFTAPTTSANTVLANYMVPTDVTQQKDVVVATTDEFNGNCNRVVPLNFKHICTAVRFVIGSEMQPGTIKRITLKGVKGKGNYNMATSQWKLKGKSMNFSQSPSRITDGNSSEGDEITTAEGTFMMLPQNLTDGASIEIVFFDGMSKQDRILTASIKGQEWPMGKTVTYKLSVSPEYDMNIELLDVDRVQDAHYVSFPITVNVKDFKGDWTLTSNLPNDVFFTDKQTELQKQGYWIDDDKGNASVTGRGIGNFTYYVYATENVTDTDRDIKLQIKPTENAQVSPVTTTVLQLCPAWNGDLGCERLEDRIYPWGFLWNKDMKIQYTMRNSLPEDYFLNIVYGLYLRWFTNYKYVKTESNGLSLRTVIIDFSQIPELNVAKSNTNGLRNTLELYNFDGVDDVSSLMDQLERWGATPDKKLPLNPTEFAARACVMKNKYGKTLVGNNDEMPVLKNENSAWYLPSKAEALSMSDEQYALVGGYWTSTAGNDNETAYKLKAGRNAVVDTEKRTTLLHVRAVRKR